MAGSDDRFANLAIAMKRKSLINNALYKTPQARLKNQSKIDKIVETWTKKNSIKYLGKILSNNSVPWGEVKTFSQFLETTTAKNYLIDAKIKKSKIKVPECAIKISSKKNVVKKNIPLIGQNNNEVFKKLGYSYSELIAYKKKNIL
jgi:crotonobetainyl-CoA:carnitine CoA-transferase CaiB-like acyl-CoA transferase